MKTKLIPIGVLLTALTIATLALVLTRPDRLDVLRSEAGFRVQFSPATKLAEGGARRGEALSNQVYVVLGTDAPRHEVLNFYLAEWASLGYTNGGGSSRIPSQHEELACAMHNSQHVVRLAFYQPDAARRLLPQSATFTTVYRVALVEKSVGSSSRPCNIMLEASSPAPSHTP
jgi:hypothetical protein